MLGESKILIRPLRPLFGLNNAPFITVGKNIFFLMRRCIGFFEERCGPAIREPFIAEPGSPLPLLILWHIFADPKP